MLVTFRPAVADDLDWLVELRAVVMRADLERVGVFDEHRVRQRFRDAFVAEHTRIIVIDGADAGCIAVRPEPDARWIEHFYLPASAQGQGVGSEVLRRVLAEPASVPARLNVLRGSAALRLYERHGFVVDTADDVDLFMTRS